MFRIPARINGGIVSTPTRMAKKVVPQKNATQNNARYSFVFKRWIYVLLFLALPCFLHNGLRRDHHKLFLNVTHMKL